MSELSTVTPNEVAAQPLTIAQAALALFAPLETEMKTLAERYRDVAFDMSTPKGFKASKDARLELRESGRFAVQRLRDKTKEQLNDSKKVVEDEATRLIAIVTPIEDAVDAQVKAHEKKLADEKEARDRIEAERKQKHLDAIATIEGYAAKAEGLPIERIEAGLAYVRDIDVSAEVFADFAVRAAAQKDSTIRALEKMIADARERAAAEALRIENERLQAQLDELKRQQAVVAALAPAPEVEPRLEPQKQAQEQPVEPAPVASIVSAAAAPVAPPASPPSVIAMPQRAQPATGAVPTLSIGAINERLQHFTVTADGLRGLGFEPAGRERAAPRYHEAAFPHMLAAMVDHLQAIHAKQAA